MPVHKTFTFQEIYNGVGIILQEKFTPTQALFVFFENQRFLFGWKKTRSQPNLALFLVIPSR